MLCPGLAVKLKVEKPKERQEWCYSGGLEEYLVEAIGGAEILPAEPFSGKLGRQQRSGGLGARLADRRGPGGCGKLRQSHPDATRRHARQRAADGTHERFAGVLRLSQPRPARCVARAGRRLGRAEFRSERKAGGPAILRSDPKSDCHPANPRRLLPGSSRDNFGIWLNQHPESGDQIAQLAIAKAQKRLKAAKKVVPEKDQLGSRFAWEARGLHLAGTRAFRDLSR